MIVTIANRHGINPKWALKWKVVSKAIQIWTMSKYFHTEIIVQDKWISSYADSRDDGVVIYDLHELNYEYWTYIDIEVNPSPEQLKKFWKFIEEQKHSGYDWFGIFFSQFLNLDSHRKDKWFCSEIVIKSLQLLGDETALKLKPNRISPAKLFKIYSKIGKIKQIESNQK